MMNVPNEVANNTAITHFTLTDPGFFQEWGKMERGQGALKVIRNKV